MADYLLEGVDVASLKEEELAAIRSSRIGFIFQTFNLLARTSAIENVELPLFYSERNLDGEQRAGELLEMLGLKGRENNNPNQLSGGQQQRVAIARSLINQPAILLADEPTGNLDSKNSAEIMEIISRLNREHGNNRSGGDPRCRRCRLHRSGGDISRRRDSFGRSKT